MRMVRVLAAWTHPDGFEPISNVLAGSNLVNAYRGQHGRDAAVTPGLLFVGDVVCTTNPAAGRGVALGFRQARALLALLDADDDLRSVAPGFDEWCLDNIRPWYDDHVYWDATELHRFAGADLDLPRVDPQSVDLSLENNVLMVRAERSRRTEEGAEYLVAERPTGSYTRQLALGDGLDLDKLTATYDNGVLMLTIPVAEQAKPRKIEVGTSGPQPRVIEHQQRAEVGG